MSLTVLIGLGLFAAILDVVFAQNDYIIEFERMMVPSVNKKYMGEVNIHNSKYNRTHLACNITMEFLIDFERNLQVEVQSYKFASNEYRLFPITFSRNICDSVDKDEFGLQNIYAYGNASRCPMRKGRYVVRNWTPDYTKFPPYIPTGKYRVDLKFFYLEQKAAIEILQIEAYGAIKSTDPLGKRYH